MKFRMSPEIINKYPRRRKISWGICYFFCYFLESIFTYLGLFFQLGFPGCLRESLDLLGKYGGAEGDRTLGLMTASHALSQLSYSPPRFSSHSDQGSEYLPLAALFSEKK